MKTLNLRECSQLTSASLENIPRKVVDLNFWGFGIKELRVFVGALQGSDADLREKHLRHFCLLSVSRIACVETETSDQHEKGGNPEMAENGQFSVSMIAMRS